MKLDDIANGTVEHEKAGSLFDVALSTADVHQVENRSENLVHPLHVLDLRIQPRINVQNSSHVIVSISFSLLLLIFQKLLVQTLILPVY